MVGRRAVLEELLDRARKLRPLRRIVEIGCGSGRDLPVLSKYGEVIAVERSETLARRARARGLAREVMEIDFFDLEPEGGVDLYCLFDVLEHVEDDEAFVARLAAHTEPGELLLMSVPACPALYSRHDALLHHYRRYRLRGLVALLERRGFEVHFSSYFLFFAFPLVALARLHEKLLERIGRAPDRVSLGEVPAWANRVLESIMRFEARLLRYLRFPIGVWAFALARRRG
jgi:SAM-dependent methyltransferase